MSSEAATPELPLPLHSESLDAPPSQSRPSERFRAPRSHDVRATSRLLCRHLLSIRTQLDLEPSQLSAALLLLSCAARRPCSVPCQSVFGSALPDLLCSQTVDSQVDRFRDLVRLFLFGRVGDVDSRLRVLSAGIHS